MGVSAGRYDLFGLYLEFLFYLFHHPVHQPGEPVEHSRLQALDRVLAYGGGRARYLDLGYLGGFVEKRFGRDLHARRYGPAHVFPFFVHAVERYRRAEIHDYKGALMGRVRGNARYYPVRADLLRIIREYRHAGFDPRLHCERSYLDVIPYHSR